MFVEFFERVRLLSRSKIKAWRVKWKLKQNGLENYPNCRFGWKLINQAFTFLR